jgi:hypothetical protein
MKSLLTCLAALLLAACGGGVGSGGTGSFASGPITGFGSIIVNGVHYDESAAQVLGEDERGFARSGLRLGMTVEVEAGPVSPANAAEPARAVATRVRVGSELVGRIEAVDAGAQTLEVNGQTVALTAATVVDDRIAGGASGLAVDAVVEVYGFLDESGGRYVATRIEPEDGASAFKVRGRVAQLDAQAGSFSVDGQRFVLAPGVGLPAGLADGDFVRAQLRPARDAQGRWVVTGFGRALPAMGERDEVELKGLITSFTAAESFAVNGVPVDASAAQVSGTLALGVRVEVEGSSEAGTLRARKVSVESDDDARQFEMRGRVASIDAMTQTFTLRSRSEVVGYAGAAFEDGDASDLRVDTEVEARGTLSADRTRLQASRVRIR